MLDRHAPLRALGPMRALGLPLLLFGIVALHAAVFGIEHDRNGVDSGHATTTVAAAVDDSHDPVAVLANDRHNAGHRHVHRCVFVLTTLAFGLGLALVRRFDVDSARTGQPKFPNRWTHHERPPPWTRATLSELSILRI